MIVHTRVKKDREMYIQRHLLSFQNMGAAPLLDQVVLHAISHTDALEVRSSDPRIVGACRHM